MVLPYLPRAFAGNAEGWLDNYHLYDVTITDIEGVTEARLTRTTTSLFLDLSSNSSIAPNPPGS